MLYFCFIVFVWFYPFVVSSESEGQDLLGQAVGKHQSSSVENMQHLGDSELVNWWQSLRGWGLKSASLVWMEYLPYSLQISLNKTERFEYQVAQGLRRAKRPEPSSGLARKAHALGATETTGSLGCFPFVWRTLGFGKMFKKDCRCHSKNSRENTENSGFPFFPTFFSPQDIGFIERPFVWII